MAVSLQELTTAWPPLKSTVLVLCTEPKPLPVMVMLSPTGPWSGETEATVGAPSTVKGTALLVALYLTTVSGPVAALGDTVAVMLVSLQETMPDSTPLISTWQFDEPQ